MDAPKVAIGVVTAAVLVATPIVASFEGLWLTAQPDRLAYDIPTACYGETEGIKLGQKFTKDQCMKMLEQKLPRYEREIDRCIKVELPVKTKASAISLAYNIGSSGFCRSTVLRRFNDGDIGGGCDAMLMWTQAGGKFRKGLLNRRNAERKLCREGIGQVTSRGPILTPSTQTVTLEPGKAPAPSRHQAPQPTPKKRWWQFWK